MQRLGFTIVELLIVIAIIGILASVAISSAGGARTDAIVAKITSEMDGVSKRASIIQNLTFSFSEVCGSDGTTQDDQVTAFITSIEAFAPGTTTCNSSVSAFAVSVPFPPDSSEHWCVDSTGAKGVQGAAIGSGDLTCS